MILEKKEVEPYVVEGSSVDFNELVDEDAGNVEWNVNESRLLLVVFALAFEAFKRRVTLYWVVN